MKVEIIPVEVKHGDAVATDFPLKTVVRTGMNASFLVVDSLTGDRQFLHLDTGTLADARVRLKDVTVLGILEVS